jgi:hypothetical protein
MRALQTIAGEFQEEDIYNMDETFVDCCWYT